MGADFFASANPVPEGVSESQNRLTAIVNTRTTAPTKITADVSSDLETWTTAGVVVSPSAANPRVGRVSVPQDGASRLFLRAKVVRRPMPVLSRWGRAKIFALEHAVFAATLWTQLHPPS